MLNTVQAREAIARFVAEDIGFGDLTAQLMIDAEASAAFAMNAREELVVAGIDAARLVFDIVDPAITCDIKVRDGTRAEKNANLMHVAGPAQSILTAERNALNLIQHLSGIATETARYVAAIEGTGCQLLDTRKTTPGLRMFEKHAVVCGGGRNHRLALDGGVMIKDNHIAVAGSIRAAVAKAKAAVPVLTKVEVECDRLDQVSEALDAGADMLLLDNMDIATLRKSVDIVDGKIPLEASGGVRLETIRAIAETGVDFVSVGRITQSAPAVDIGLDARRA